MDLPIAMMALLLHDLFDAHSDQHLLCSHQTPINNYQNLAIPGTKKAQASHQTPSETVPTISNQQAPPRRMGLVYETRPHCISNAVVQ